MTRTHSIIKIAVIAAIIVVLAFLFAAQYARAAHPAGPAGYWALDDGADPTADLSGHGNNGDVNGGAVFTGAGIAPTPSNVLALTFDGVDDFVEIAHDGNLDMTDEYSLSVWLNVTDFATYRPILVRGTTDADDIEVYVQVGTGDLIVAHNRGNGGTFDFVGFDDPPAGLFHLLVTYDGADVKAYYNGVAATVVQGTAAVADPEDTDEAWWIGKVDHTGFGGTFLFKGLIDEVQIYDRVLTVSEIEILSNTDDTLFVDDDGQIGFGSIDCDGIGVGAYTAIQDAVDAASPGDTVQVCPGTYVEQVVINKNLTLDGGSSSTTIIQAPISPVLESDGDGMTFVEITGAVVATFKNFTVEGALGGITSAIHVHDGANATIEDNVVLGTDALSGALIGHGITIGDSLDGDVDVPASGVNSISDNTLSGFHRAGVVVIGVGNAATVSGNTITGAGATALTTQQGITMQDGAGGSIAGNTVSEVSYAGAPPLTATGIFLWDAASGISVTGNTITGSQTGIMVQATEDLEISGNIVSSPVGSIGIWLLGRGGAGTGCDGGDGLTPGLGCSVEAMLANNTLTGSGAGTGVAISWPIGVAPSFTAAPVSADMGTSTFSGWERGISVTSASATNTVQVHRSNVAGNGLAGIANDDPATVVGATCNWWGAVSGPSGSGPGTGDSVSANVTFQPWLTSPDLVNGPCDGPLPDVTVTIVKYIDAIHANAINAEGQTFPMQSTWDAENIGAGSGSFSLGPVGLNDPDPYEATTADMTAGADYSTNEDTSGAVVGTACSEGKPFALAGYSSGDTEAEAASNATSSSAVLTDITTEKYIIVWNEKCEGTLIVKKVLVNDNSGTTATSTFTFKVNGGSSQAFEADGQNDIAVIPGSYSVVEDAAPGYTTTYSNTENGDANCSSLAVPDGGTVICTITNNDTPPPPPAPPAADACATPLVAPFGYTLVNGSVGNDNLLIASFTMFVGNGGNDKVRAGSGNFIICTGGGKDTITINGSGAVTIDAGDGDNTVTAPAGVTGFIMAGSGKDKLTFGSGARTISAGDGNNIVTTTGSGDQTITAGSGDDKITTGSGNDTISAGSGKNTVVSNGGNDNITGLGGKDIINGGTGVDTCNADGGVNIVVNCEL